MAMDTLVSKFQKNMDFSSNSSECVKFFAQQYYPFLLKKNGIMFEILNDAAHKYNFCYNLNMTPDGVMSYGIYLPQNKTYTGMLGLVHRGIYEAALDPFVVSQDHLFELEATTFIFFDPISVIMPYPVFKPNISGFLMPFTLQMWVAIASSFIIVALAYFILTNFGRQPDNHFILEQGSPSFWEKFFRGFYVSLEILLGQDIYNHGPGDSRLKIRLLVCAWLLAGFIISQSFKCNLKSMLIKPKVHLAFSTFEEMVNQKEIRYFIGKGTVFEQLLMSSPPESLYGRIYKGLTERPKAGEVTSVLQMGTSAFIGATILNEGILQLTFTNGQCPLTIMPEKLNIIRTMGLYFREGSKYRDYFNNIIVSYRESGILQLLNNIHLNNAQKCTKVADNIFEERALTLKDYYGVFALYLAGNVLAFLAFLGEACIFHLKSYTKK